MTYKKITLEKIFELQLTGIEVCGYARNITYDGNKIRATCALNYQRCYQKGFPQRIEECELYKRIWKT